MEREGYVARERGEDWERGMGSESNRGSKEENERGGEIKGE